MGRQRSDNVNKDEGAGLDGNVNKDEGVGLGKNVNKNKGTGGPRFLTATWLRRAR